MVDLAKIRKKAKKKDDAPAGAPAPPPAVPAAPAPPSVVEEPPITDGDEGVADTAGEGAGAPQLPATGNSATGNSATGNTTSKLDAFKEQAGKRRTADAAKAEALEQERLEVLTFIIAGEQYAVDIERIVEIVTPRPLTRVPNADTSIVGIISLRGTIVTLVDVRGKLRHASAPANSADTRIVVIDFHNEMIGFVVDRVLRVVKTAAGEIEPHPVVHATELDDSIRGVFRAAGALTILLDLDKLLDHTWT